MRKSLTVLGCIGVAVAAWAQPAQAQSDIADGLCSAHSSVVEIVLSMRMDGMPISVAENAVQSASNVDMRLYSVMLATVRLAYSNPSHVQSLLASGEWQRRCASYVRGY
jgi:hypothetical protein